MTAHRPRRPAATAAGLLGLALIALPAAHAVAQNARPAILDRVAFEQRIGNALPLDAVFRNHADEAVRLGDYFGERPVLIVPAYYHCPMLCTLVINGVVTALRALPFDVGRDFTVVTFTIDPEETPAQASEKRSDALSKYRRPTGEEGWHFLTGPAESIERLTDAIGFRYARDADSGQYAHASGIVVATPDGRVSHYFYGVEFSPRDLRLSLVEASESRLGSPTDLILLYCFQYDPTTGRYTRVAMRAMRLAGAATILTLGFGIMLMLRRDRRRAEKDR